jgi:hypothetical protein
MDLITEEEKERQIAQMIEKQLLSTIDFNNMSVEDSQNALAEHLAMLLALSKGLQSGGSQATGTTEDDDKDEDDDNDPEQEPADMSEFYRASIINDDDLFARFLDGADEDGEDEKAAEDPGAICLPVAVVKLEEDTAPVKSPIQNPDDIIKSNEEFIAKFLAEHQGQLPVHQPEEEEEVVEEYEEESVSEVEEEILLEDPTEEEYEEIEEEVDHSSPHATAYGDYARALLGMGSYKTEGEGNAVELVEEYETSGVEEDSADEDNHADRHAADYYGYGDSHASPVASPVGRPRNSVKASDQFVTSLSDVEENTESSAMETPVIPHYRMTRRLSTGDYARMMLGIPIPSQKKRAQESDSEEEEVEVIDDGHNSTQSLEHSCKSENNTVHLSRIELETQVREMFLSQSVIEKGLLAFEDVDALEYATDLHLQQLSKLLHIASSKRRRLRPIRWDRVTLTLQSIKGGSYCASSSSSEDESGGNFGRRGTPGDGVMENMENKEESVTNSGESAAATDVALGNDSEALSNDSAQSSDNNGNDDWQNESLGSGYSLEADGAAACDSSVTDFDDVSNNSDDEAFIEKQFHHIDVHKKKRSRRCRPKPSE